MAGRTRHSGSRHITPAIPEGIHTALGPFQSAVRWQSKRAASPACTPFAPEGNNAREGKAARGFASDAYMLGVVWQGD